MTDAERIAKLEADLAEIHTVLLAAARDVRPSATREDTPTPLLARQVASPARSTLAELDEARLCLLAEAGDPGGAVGLHPGWGWDLDGWRLIDGESMRATLRRARPRYEGTSGLQWWTPGHGRLPVPAGLTIRDAMRWVESQVLPKEATEAPRG